MQLAARMNEGKPLLSFILDFPKALTAFSRVKELGAAKYDFDNWTKGGKPDREYLDACLRHMLAFKQGEAFADDSGCHHLAHALWNLMALLELNVDTVVDDAKFAECVKYWKAKKESVKTEADAVTENERAAIAHVTREGR